MDIVRESADSYFLNALRDTTIVHGKFDCRTFAAFVLATIVYKFEQGQANALRGSLLSISLEQINDPNPILRKWFAICLGNLWLNYEDARWSGVRDLAHEKMFALLKDSVPEVRAATVYALGTFISSSLERSQQADNLDRQIAMYMLDSVSSDMSPLVRMELVAALQWIVKLFDNHFVEVYLRDDGSGQESKEGSLKRTGRVRTASERNLMMMNAERAYSHASSYSSVYSKLWHGIVNLSRDPYPEVAIMGSKVTDYIKQMTIELAPSLQMIPLAKEVICDLISTGSHNSSHSMPSSPNVKNIHNYMSNSGSAARLNESTGSNSSNREKIHKLRIPIVKTNLVEWEISSFARPLKYLVNHKGTSESDQFSQETLVRKQRFVRNTRVRKEAADQQRLAAFHNLKTQSFVGKTAMIPSIVKLHPYEQQIAVAYLDRIMLKDWAHDISTTLSPMQLSSSHYTHHSVTIQTTTNICKKTSVTAPTSMRVSSLQFINAHDRGLVLAGYDDGSIRIWRNSCDNQNASRSVNGNLVTAFQALDDPPPRSARIYGLQTAWHQSTQTIIAAGESKVIRLWDAEKELKFLDIPVGSDFPVSHISCSPNALFAIGTFDARTANAYLIVIFSSYF